MISRADKPLIAILAEASPLIGTGHVVEAFTVASELLHKGIPLEIWVNKETPEALIKNAPCVAHVIGDFSTTNLRRLSLTLKAENFRLVVTNFRRVNIEQIDELRRSGCVVACVDELGNTDLNCDLVINGSIVREYHRYRSRSASMRVYAGPQYMLLSSEYRAFNSQSRAIGKKINHVVVAMGGADRSATTAKIVLALADRYNSIRKHVVLGPGFADHESIDALIARSGGSNWFVYRGLPSLAALLAQADVAFSAGGNTLYELACVGTPTIVLYEDEHERAQALTFQSRGFGLCLGKGAEVKPGALLEALQSLERLEERQNHARAGMALIDGRGAERIVTLLLEFIVNENTTVKALVDEG